MFPDSQKLSTREFRSLESCQEWCDDTPRCKGVAVSPANWALRECFLVGTTHITARSGWTASSLTDCDQGAELEKIPIVKSDAANWYRYDMTPDKAHDGDYSTYYSARHGDLQNWLKLSLSGRYEIAVVKITNRLSCCQERIIDTAVKVYSGGIETGDCGTISASDIDSDHPTDPEAQTYTMNCNNAEGDMIMITDSPSDKLGHAISEVVVYIVSCEEGTYRDASMTKCAKCNIGEQPNNAKTACIPCKAGTFKDGSLSVCKQCPTNSYSAERAGLCITCPRGSHASEDHIRCVSCESLPSNWKEIITETQFPLPPGAEVSLKCSPGHTLTGDSTLTCVEGTNFSSMNTPLMCARHVRVPPGHSKPRNKYRVPGAVRCCDDSGL
ncbi:uncharacterized protein LOC134820256 [Bolinopsis microptera]|uniref:uncharacterized protein LOC134820256 n=1 Tax=Bolinopsis microptera TaxID=2820187 RepID=UPI003079782E